MISACQFQKKLLLIYLSFTFISYTFADVRIVNEPTHLISPSIQHSIENSLDEPELYWEWEPEPRWLMGINWGGITFFGSLGYGETFFGSTLSFYDAIE
jgi:hypothetical protein